MQINDPMRFLEEWDKWCRFCDHYDYYERVELRKEFITQYKNDY